MFDIVLYAVALPMLITGSVLFSGWWLSKPKSKSDREVSLSGDATSAKASFESWVSAAASIGLGISYVACHLGLHGAPAGNQPEAWEWLLLLVPVAVLISVAVSRLRLSTKVRMLIFVLVAIAVGWFLVPSFQPSPWLWRFVLASSVFVLASAQVNWRPAITLPIAWVVCGASALPVLIASANAKFGFFATSISASSGAMILFWLFARRSNEHVLRGYTDAVSLVVSVLLPAILFSGYFNDYGGVSLDAFAAIAAAPLLLWLSWVAKRRLAWLSPLLVVVACGYAVFRVWPILTAEPAY